MHRTFTFRLKATRKQDAHLSSMLDNLCGLYNMCLRQRRDEWEQNQKSISYYDQQKQLTAIRQSSAIFAAFPTAIQRDPIRRIDRAFKAFFRRVKKGDKPGYPRFRPTSRYESFEVDRDNFTVNDETIRVVGVGHIKFKTRCRLRGTPRNLVVKRHGKHWAATIAYDLGAAPEKVSVATATGIDLGLTSLATLSDGTEIANPRWTKQMEEKLAEANRDLERKKKGSRNRAKARERLRRIHQKIAGRRSSYLVSVAKQLVSRYDLIAHEDLKVSEMAQSRLAKSIMDAAWSQLIHRLTCEAEYAGKWVIPVNPRGTTQTCSGCGEKVPKKLWNRSHDCPHCGLSLGRDHNAALNILRLGESLVATQKV